MLLCNFEKKIMDRRKLLKLGALASGSLVFPTLLSFGDTKKVQNGIINQGHIQLKLNDIEILLFSDGHILLNNPQPIFAPDISSKIVKKELEKLFLAVDKLEGAINVMLIKIADKIILIDTGSGYHFGETGGWLLDNLLKSGIKATDVTDVFITHAHIDHIGGIILKDETLAYPNAQYHIAKKEFDFWTSVNPDFSNTKNPNPNDGVIFAQNVLNSIKDKLTFFNYGDVLFSCIKTELAEGHTPGHTIFTVFSDDKSIKHIVDTFHTPLLIAKPDWGTQWDINFNKGVQTRKHILKNCFLNRTLVMTTHLPWPGLGYIGKNGNNYQWLPISYFSPNEIVL